MGKRKGGYRRRSRQLLRKSYRTLGKVSITDFLATYRAGDRVALCPEPAYQKGMYHVRHAGKSGTVARARGRCYEVVVRDGSKEKTLIVHPVHLRRVT